MVNEGVKVSRENRKDTKSYEGMRDLRENFVIKNFSNRAYTHKLKSAETRFFQT